LSGLPLGSTGRVMAMATQLFGMNSHTVYLSPAPLYHAAPYGFVSATTAIGGTAVIMEHFDAEAFLQAIERYHVTHTQVVPTMFIRLLALPAQVREAYDLSSLRCVVHAAAPCPVPVKQRMMEWWGPIIHEYYSGTEGIGFTYCGPDEWLSHPGTVGRPAGGAIHIVDDDGQEVLPGTVGDVFFSGGQRFEYFNDDEKTAGSYLPNGWATFGDVGYVDLDGYLFLTDRRSNMIIVGGVNVYPQEAENLLIVHPDVDDAAVFGVPDSDLGETVKAVVQLASGVDPSPTLEADLVAYCREHLASVKCPKSIDFRRDLPREPNGKLLKRILRDEYRAQMISADTDD
jgi:long-chain acyl-CoA synthetase